MKVFFASEKYFDNKVIHPRIPENRINNLEDSVTKRICVALSIDGCLSGVSRFEEGNIINIHEAEVDLKDIYFPKRKDLPDYFLTGEIWVLTDLKLRIFAKIILRKRIEIIINDNVYHNIYTYDLKFEGR